MVILRLKIFYLLLIVLFLAGCVEQTVAPNEIKKELSDFDQTKNETNIQSKEKFVNEVKIDSPQSISLRDDMLEKAEPSKILMKEFNKTCSNLTFEEHKNRCYQNVAMLNKDINVCSNIEDSDYDSNLDECYGAVGYATENVSLCKSISQRIFHNECIWGIAIKTKNISLCEELKTFTWNDACYSMLGSLTKNISLCEKPQLKDYRIGCYQQLAHTLQDPTICDKIGKEDHLYVNACKSMVMKREAWRLSCDYVYSNFARQSCILAWEERTDNFVEKIIPDLCDNLSNDLHERDWCLQNLAYVTSDDSYCESIEVDSEKSFCIKMALAKKLNVSKCYDLTILSEKQLCIAEHAIYTKNTTMCNLLYNISDTQSMARRDECIKYIGVATNNISLCKETTNREDLARCINHIARATHNISTCDSLLEWKKGNFELKGARDQCIAGLYLLQDDWDYDCLWAPDSTMAYACYHAKAEGVRLGKTKS